MSSIQDITHQQSFNTPVLFLVFNRPHTTQQVFETIRKAQPPRLYIASDGARNNQEREKVQAVRSSVIDNIDWPCEVQTLFRDEPLGCTYAVSTAINWFFDNEEQGIILEDDCLPNPSFFLFCQDMLNLYKNDMRVGSVSANNFQGGITRGDADYYFSIYSHIWGWASWSNRWKMYDVELNNIHNTSFFNSVFEDKQTKHYWLKIFNSMKEKKKSILGTINGLLLSCITIGFQYTLVST